MVGHVYSGPLVATLLLVGLLGLLASPSHATIRLDNLQVERLTEPLGVDVQQPIFSWAYLNDEQARVSPAVAQANYRLVVAPITPKGVGAAVFDSGVIAASNPFGTFKDTDTDLLASDTPYTWTVTTTCNGVSLNASSEFTTGIFTAFSNTSKWLGPPGGGGDNGTSLFRMPFSLSPGKKLWRGSAFVSGVGYSELYINGEKADWRVLDPARSDYNKRCLYSSYDITSRLSASNVVGVMVAPGWAHNQMLRGEIHLHYTDGSIDVVGTSVGWMYSPSFITYASVYNGENYDARLEQPGWNDVGFDATNWQPATVLSSFSPVMSSQLQQPVEVQQIFPAISVGVPSENVYVFDFGQNLAGWVRIRLPFCEAGTVVTIRHAELLQHPPYGPVDGNIYTDNLRSAKATDQYTCKGDPEGEAYEPRFTYHGFRYAEVTGLPSPIVMEDIQAHFLHSKFEQRGTISSGNDLLNKIHHNCQYGAMCNLVGYPSDCDQRDERQGWMGDAALAAELELIQFNMYPIYSVWTQSMVDDQQPDGGLPSVVPGHGDSGDPAWTTAFPTIVWGTYKFYGDATLVKRRYPAIKKYFGWLESHYNSTGLVQMFSQFGDWCPPPPVKKVSGHIVSAGTYINDVAHMIEMAAAVGNTADVKYYTDFHAKLCDEFNTAFFNAATNTYLDGSQAATSFPLWLGIIPKANQEAVVQNLVSEIMKSGHLATGIVSLRYLLEGLAKYNQTDAALTMLLQTTYPSFGYEIYNEYEPATTVWELWDSDTTGPGMNSRNHIMFGTADTFLWKMVGGIWNTNAMDNISPAPPNMPVGWEHITIKPFVATSVMYLHNITLGDASIDTPRGEAAVTWTLPQPSGGGCAVSNENDAVTLTCGNEPIKAVEFACYGSPPTTGWMCPNPSGQGSCACAANSTSVVASLCVGKMNCTFTPTDTLFGDPCYGTRKEFAASVTCPSDEQTARFSLKATIPLTSYATVHIPTAVHSPTTNSPVEIQESGKTVWKDDAYVPGAEGISGAVVAGDFIAFSVVSGTYQFEMLQ